MPEDPAASADAEVVAEPAIAPDIQAEVARLHLSARRVGYLLSLLSLVTFGLGVYSLTYPDHLTRIVAIALVGISGSTCGAVTSCLARYATGIALDSGQRLPANVEGEVFDRRMELSFLLRPLLGAIIAPLAIWASGMLATSHTELLNSTEAVVLIAFFAGLYAKAILIASKNLFKAVFRA